ncbi:hypothetical protein [Vallitalea sp.]|jgi:hypothetical protein|uniref:hypothetical protein n=1 Tax=Vallitalea sp. TaxID=1882829 RepID=UPI0025FD4F35|nr:hypothetical protein [Vallitalea sp.]MCT4686093.1 hypothetical protein [Vallitalea sp.]
MADYTKKYAFKKPSQDEFYNISDQNTNWDKAEEIIDKKVDKAQDKVLSSNDYTNEDKDKLTNIEDGANKYMHPSNHPAVMISITDTQDNFTSNNVEGALAEVKKLVQDTATQVSQQLEVSSFHIEASSVAVVGSKKTDNLCWDNKCCYANTSTSANITLGHTTIDKLRFNKYTLIVRLKSKNNSHSSGLVKVDVLRKNSSSYQTVSSRTIKANEFANTSQYKSFYMPFEYCGPKATNNELKIQLTLLKQSSVFEVSLDSISVTLTALGVFSI